MPYIFALLVLVNAGLLGYFVFLNNSDSGSQPSVVEAKNLLTKEISFENTSDSVAPIIGSEK